MPCLPPNHHRLLRSYFASGWAFLIPYQLAYLLYYWRQWPANPGTATAANTFIPSLLVVYWAMHAAHLTLGALALWANPGAKSEARKLKGEPTAPGGDERPEPATTKVGPYDSPLLAPDSPLPAPRSYTPRSWLPAPRSILRRFLSLFTLHPSLFFWSALALLFYLPGVYLEFPSDPWAHLGRITEWQVHEVVHWHTAGYKSLYFFAYSLVGRLAPENLLFWLNLYHVAICLLLSWQYYRLARVVGLPVRWAGLFVVGNVLLFGNVTFSFFRYYSLASTAFAQIGTIALVRLTITWAKQKSEERRVKGEKAAPGSPLPAPGSSPAPPSVLCPPPSAPATTKVGPYTPGAPLLAPSSVLCPPPPSSPSSGRPLSDDCPPTSPPSVLGPPLPDSPSSTLRVLRFFVVKRSVLRLLSLFTLHFSLFFAALLLAVLIASNHVQGIGFAVLGCTGVVAWRLGRWRRAALGWLLGGLLLGSVALYYWWPYSPKFLPQVVQPGWIAPWYGFNLLTPSSPATDRMVQILGGIGLLNLAGGLYLCLRRHVAGWLTVSPVLLLLLPLGAIPLADIIIRSNSIITFHRMFLVIPAGLALVVLLRELALRLRWTKRHAVRQNLHHEDAKRTKSPAGDKAMKGILTTVYLRARRVFAVQNPALPAPRPELRAKSYLLRPWCSWSLRGENSFSEAPSSALPAPISGDDQGRALHSELRPPPPSSPSSSRPLSDGCPPSSAPATTKVGPYTPRPLLSPLAFRLSPFRCLLSALLLLTLLPASKPWYNRFWQALACPPADLSFTREPAELAQLFNRSAVPGHGLAAEAPRSPLPAPRSQLPARPLFTLLPPSRSASAAPRP